MALVNLPLPTDTNGTGFLGLADPTGNQWTLWRARNVGSSSLGGVAAATSDLGVVLAAPASNGGTGYAELAAVADGSSTIGPLGSYQTLRTAGLLYAYNGTNWQRLLTDASGDLKIVEQQTAADGDAQATLTLPGTLARLEGFNGATWDRLRTLAGSGDGLGALKTATSATSAVTWINALAITDTASHSTALGGMQDGLREVWISVQSTLNQAVTVTIGMGNALLNWPITAGYVVAAGATLVLMPWLGDAAPNAIGSPALRGPFLAKTWTLKCALQCTLAPSSGVVTVQLYGRY